MRKELSRVYWSTKDGVLPIDRAKGLVYILSQISATLKAEPDGDGELAALLAQVREKLKGGT
ncbi:MAG: hypothetical protein CFE45_28790 [Burkholderiales bacterium PBB5]|nr:MAG: hypothetical protein CFE45_28790 [Burkholderiales bacterium PBB5]